MTTTAIAATPERHYPLTQDGDPDFPAFTDQECADFWNEADAKERMALDLFRGYKTAAKNELERRIRERRQANPKAIGVPHRALKIEMIDEYGKYEFEEALLPQLQAELAEDEFEKIAKFVPLFQAEPVPEHWEIRPTASGTVKALIERYDGTTLGDLLLSFMSRKKTGEKLVIEARKSSEKKNVTPINGAA